MAIIFVRPYYVFLPLSGSEVFTVQEETAWAWNKDMSWSSGSFLPIIQYQIFLSGPDPDLDLEIEQ